jgi:hypothetical protein
MDRKNEKRALRNLHDFRTLTADELSLTLAVLQTPRLHRFGLHKGFSRAVVRWESGT